MCAEIQKQLKEAGDRAVSVEGYEQGEWILLDFSDFLVHIFSESARKFYDLERLWHPAKVVQIKELLAE